MKIAVVGASGVLGRSLVPLLAEKHRVLALVRTPETAQKLFGTQAQALACDLLAPNIGDRLPALLADCDAVIHAATAIPSDFSAPGAWDANTRIRREGTAHLLAAALEVGANIYIQQSICFAYPDRGDAWISEDTPLDLPRAIVIEMEQQVREIAPSRIRWTILRGGTFVGSGTFQDDKIAALRAGTDVVACDGSHYVPYVHVADVATAFAAAVENAPSGSIFNIADEPLREGEYSDRLAETLGVPKPPRNSDAPCPTSQRASSQAAHDVLGWTPMHSVIPQHTEI